ncbi:glycoside hydrolase [Xylariales sp. PMI_506]|nr:glycoside hydrolase [Xylariales sp. PMI_506]
MSMKAVSKLDQAEYKNDTITGLNVLQDWYNTSTGLWDTTGWWNSANCLTVLADFAALDSANDSGINFAEVIQNTYTKAQETTIQAVKTLSAGMMPVSSYSRVSKRGEVAPRGYENFLDDYYDDEGWWAMALIRSYDYNVNAQDAQEYLQSASYIFDDMTKGNSTCGGIYWSKTTTYTNAIANELYLNVAAALANRMSNKDYYLNIAQTQWEWFKNSGMINDNNLINDGLDDNCKNNGEQTWTYNQGVILGGLVELYKATGNDSLLSEAQTIATAAINTLVINGTLYEGCEPNCGDDGAQFKGIFMRNLMYLQQVAPLDTYKTFILNNAQSIWNNDRNSRNKLGVTWTGPYTTATAGTQSSALDALVAAYAVA